MTEPTTEQRQMSAAKLATLIALLQAQQAIRQQMSKAAVAAALAPLRGFTSWWDATATTAMIHRILRVVQPIQLRAARATDAYAAKVLTLMDGRTYRPVGAVDITKLRRAIPPKVAEDLVRGHRDPGWLILGDTIDGGNDHVHDDVPFATDGVKDRFVDPADPYGRVADAYRYNIVARGDSPDVAQAKAEARISAVAWTDVTLAVREQYQASFDRDRVEGWRRILLYKRQDGGPPCGLCVVAADRVYKKEDLQPIHDLCRCGVLPILDGLDPGLKLNRDDLNAIYQAAGGTGGDAVRIVRGRPKAVSPGLKRVRVALAEHGELGPILVDADQSFRGPREVAATQVPDRKVRAAAQLASLEATLAGLERRAAAGELKSKAPLEWQRNKVAELRRELTHA